MADRDIRGLSDASLVVAVGRWREEALAEIYRRHGGPVHGLARRVTGVRELADDVTQEVFTRLWREPERFDPERGSLRAFLLVQTHRRAVDAVRSEVRRRQREEQDGASHTLVGDLDAEVGELIRSEQVRAAVAELPDTERKPIQL